MKKRLADYIAEKLVEAGICRSFSVVGGGAMHLNDALGHNKGIQTLYQHHEQACAMAAESYARIHNVPALLCVTSGPGGTNTITGVLGAYLDSLPMIVLSGQVRHDNTARWSGRVLRAMGDQEFDILQSVSCMCKYSEMLIDPYRVRYAIEKAIYLSQTGRPGPCWLDIPVDVQGCMIETEDLLGFDVSDFENGGDGWEKREVENKHSEFATACRKFFVDEEEKKALHELYEKRENPHVLGEDLGRQEDHGFTHWEDFLPLAKQVLEKIRASKRPIFYTGNGVRIAGAETMFLALSEKLGIPVVLGWNAPDIFPTKHPLNAGRPGGRGDRPGNLAVQNADCILSIGSRLNIRQVGYSFRDWAPEAYVMQNDIDKEEIAKPSVHCDLQLHGDAKALIRALLELLKEEKSLPLFKGGEGIVRAEARKFIREKAAEAVLEEDKSERLTWLDTVRFYQANYPTILPEYRSEETAECNVYALVEKLSERAEEDQITVVGNGSPCVAGGQSYIIKKGTRFISQDGVASMGYGLPAGIGAYYAAIDFTKAEEEKLKQTPYWQGKEESYPPYRKKDIIVLTGDGSIQMNLQELQTIIHHKMPLKIFVVNNGGYHSIRQTQNSFFGKPLVGIGVDSGMDGEGTDLSFPSLEKLAHAYGYPYISIHSNKELSEGIEKTLSQDGPVLCEVFVSLTQQFLPKSSAKRDKDGNLFSPPLQDMDPFLPEEEMEMLMLLKKRQ
ncbi:thiamine pyrophosphate-binding protein [Oribacterium parvum]